MRLVPFGVRIAGLLLAAAIFGAGPGAARDEDRTAEHKIKSATHRFDARSITVSASLAHFEIVATDTPGIRIDLTGLGTLVDTVRFDVANDVLTIRDESTRIDYNIIPERQNIVVGSGNIIINNIGNSESHANKFSTFSEDEMKLLPLTFKSFAPKHISVHFDRAMGGIKLDGLTGVHQINLSGNGTLSGERLAGRLSLDAAENATARIQRTTLDRLSIVANENSDVKFAGSAYQTSIRVKGNAETEFSGAAEKAEFVASENASIAARGTLKSVTRKQSGNAEIEIR